MTPVAAALDFTLPAELEAREPPEARGVGRDGVRLLAGRRSTGEVTHHQFTDLLALLSPGDVLVVNTSPTLPAAIDVASDAVVQRATGEAGPVVGCSPAAGLVVHVSTELPDGSWVIELRRRVGRANEPYRSGFSGQVYRLRGGGVMRLVGPYTEGRLWTARFDVDTQARRPPGSPVETVEPPSVVSYLLRFGQPIRYGYVDRDWPLSAYQTVFAPPIETVRTGSAEMPSAARPFTAAMVTRLVAAGIVFAPVTLHTGVASPEAHEKPYPERFDVPPSTARLVTEARRAGARVIAVGTTAVRALESAADPAGVVHPASGWTDLFITPDRGVRVVDGLLTGFHEPQASHLAMLKTVAGPDLLERCYRAALDSRYLWHEFGDVNLLLP